MQMRLVRIITKASEGMQLILNKNVARRRAATSTSPATAGATIERVAADNQFVWGNDANASDGAVGGFVRGGRSRLIHDLGANRGGSRAGSALHGSTHVLGRSRSAGRLGLSDDHADGAPARARRPRAL